MNNLHRELAPISDDAWAQTLLKPHALPDTRGEVTGGKQLGAMEVLVGESTGNIAATMRQNLWITTHRFRGRLP